MSGITKNTLAGLPQPSGFPSNPQCTIISSGNILSPKNPTRVGNNITIDDIISFHLFFFIIFIFSFQICYPKHYFFEHRCVQLVINVFPLSFIAYEVGILKH